MNQLEIIRNNVEFCKRSGVSVDADSSMSVVTIQDADTELTLQGHEADAFLDSAKALYEEQQVITMDDAYLFLAYDYLDLLGNT